MDKYQKQVEQTLLDNEKEAFNELKKTYTNALKETKLMVKQLQADVDILEKANLENKSILQSKIYQLNYQKAMDEQLTAILKVVETENVRNTQSFLTKMYEDSYLGINYSLQQKGIPILMPINHKLIVDTINKPIEDLNFKDRLYKNNKEFKKTVKAEISRGLATGKSYHEIAQQISLVTQVDLNKTYRIVRTEGGRVSSEAKFESMQHAKSVGADIVKVWDSTLDHRTRELHAILDQQWEEIDEPFKVQGMEAMYPHGFGTPEMDINCRCVLLSVPRWDLEGEITKYDNEHGYLIKVSNYQAWKDGFYTKIKELDIVETVIAEAENRISGYKKGAKAVSNILIAKHVTTEENYKAIIDNTFDLRKAKSNIFGRGIYASDDEAVNLYYLNATDNGVPITFEFDTSNYISFEVKGIQKTEENLFSNLIKQTPQDVRDEYKDLLEKYKDEEHPERKAFVEALKNNGYEGMIFKQDLSDLTEEELKESKKYLDRVNGEYIEGLTGGNQIVAWVKKSVKVKE